jgi:hypothetical protein
MRARLEGINDANRRPSAPHQPVSSQQEGLECNGVRGARFAWDPRSRQINTWGTQTRFGVSNGPRAERDPHRSVKVPSHRFARVPGAAKPVFLKSLLRNSKFTDGRHELQFSSRRSPIFTPRLAKDVTMQAEQESLVPARLPSDPVRWQPRSSSCLANRVADVR